jgi:hypothetical protein
VLGRQGVGKSDSARNKKPHHAWRPQNESARGSKSVRSKNERGSFYRLRVVVGVGEMNYIDSILIPGWVGVKFFFENFLPYRILKFSHEKKVKAAFPASNAEWAAKKCKLTREYPLTRERED